MLHVMHPSFAELFTEFDGRSVEPFRRVAELLPQTSASLVQLVRWLSQLEPADAASKAETPVAAEVGATWVVKHFLEQGVATDQQTARMLCGLLDRLVAQDAVLHVLQCLPFLNLELPPGQARALSESLHRHRLHKSAFVRAWSYNGLALLAIGTPTDRAQVMQLLKQASTGESAAVKARIRHALHALEKAAPQNP